MSPMAKIHPTAIVDSQAQLADGVEIGPHCIIEGPVKLGEGVRIIAQAHLLGPLEVGEGTIIWPFAVLGREPQDVKFKTGDPTAGVVIGRECLIREHATVHASTRQDRPTRVGDRVFMMQGSHVGHDAQISDRVVLVNGALIGGHAEIHELSNLGGNAGVHQFARVGRVAMLTGNMGISRDVLPYCTCRARNRMAGINSIGMRRAGYAREDIRATQMAFRELIRPSLPQGEVLSELDRRSASCEPLADMARFIRESKRGICASENAPPPGFGAWMRGHDALDPEISEMAMLGEAQDRE